MLVIVWNIYENKTSGRFKRGSIPPSTNVSSSTMLHHITFHVIFFFSNRVFNNNAKREIIYTLIFLSFFTKGNVLSNTSGCVIEMKVKGECLIWVNHFLKVGLQPFNLSELVWKRIHDTCRVTDYHVYASVLVPWNIDVASCVRYKVGHIKWQLA